MMALHNICKSYDKPILDDISLQIPSGKCTLLAGGCGSGKSVLLRILAGLERSDSGHIWLNDQLVHPHNKPIATLLMQNATSQILGETVEEDLYLWPIMSGKSDREARQIVERTLMNFDLQHMREHRTATLSGGQMRLLLIAGIVQQDYPIILLDEPFANLDYKSVLQVRKAISQLLAWGKTLIIATHEIEKVISLSTHLVVLQNGRMILDAELPLNSDFDWEKFQLKNPYAPAWQW